MSDKKIPPKQKPNKKREIRESFYITPKDNKRERSILPREKPKKPKK